MLMSVIVQSYLGVSMLRGENLPQSPLPANVVQITYGSAG